MLGASSRKDGYLEGNNYIVSWCVGHLVGLADASSYDERFAKWRYSDLPIVPEEWLFEVPKDKQKQFKVLCDLMRDKRVTELVCATDAGREGELIFRLVYKKAGCTKPFKRLWISSLEDSAIREALPICETAATMTGSMKPRLPVPRQIGLSASTAQGCSRHSIIRSWWSGASKRLRWQCWWSVKAKSQPSTRRNTSMSISAKTA